MSFVVASDLIYAMDCDFVFIFMISDHGTILRSPYITPGLSAPWLALNSTTRNISWPAILSFP